MSQEKYFFIYNSDGDTHVRVLTREKLLEWINDDEGKAREFLGEDLPDSDTNYWGRANLIIKGRVVVPEKKQVVTEYGVE